MSDVRYSWTLLRAGAFRLDGGSMFGLIPRTVWSRSAPADDKGRIAVEHNCLLLERSGTPHAGEPKYVLIETGSGEKLDAKSRDLFAMGDRTILDALREVSCDPKDIGAVIPTHLHFDHAGGLTRLAKPGETPDWTGSASGMAGPRPDHGVKVAFPNARLFVQSREWDDARHQRSVMTRTYFADHLEPWRLEPWKERLVRVESPRPYAPGVIPERDEAPIGAVSQRTSMLPGVPGVGVFLTPGHTWGQQAVTFVDVRGRRVVFTPDVLPTAWHVGASYSLAYDVEPYTSMLTKRWFLSEASAGDWVLVLDHEPGNPVRRVRANGKGWYDLAEESA